MANNNLVLIIDADIARSASSTEHPVSSSGRKVLEVIMASKHTICFCPKLLEEWKKHRSGFTAKWLVSMYAKRKVTHKDNNHIIEDIISKIDDHTKNKEIALKDVHLIDSSLVNSKIIFSNDDNARKAFIYFSSNVGQIKNITWLNSITDNEVICETIKLGSVHPKATYLKE